MYLNYQLVITLRFLISLELIYKLILVINFYVNIVHPDALMFSFQLDGVFKSRETFIEVLLVRDIKVRSYVIN